MKKFLVVLDSDWEVLGRASYPYYARAIWPRFLHSYVSNKIRSITPYEWAMMYTEEDIRKKAWEVLQFNDSTLDQLLLESMEQIMPALQKAQPRFSLLYKMADEHHDPTIEG